MYLLCITTSSLQPCYTLTHYTPAQRTPLIHLLYLPRHNHIPPHDLLDHSFQSTSLSEFVPLVTSTFMSPQNKATLTYHNTCSVHSPQPCVHPHHWHPLIIHKCHLCPSPNQYLPQSISPQSTSVPAYQKQPSLHISPILTLNLLISSTLQCPQPSLTTKQPNSPA